MHARACQMHYYTFHMIEGRQMKEEKRATRSLHASEKGGAKRKKKKGQKEKQRNKKKKKKKKGE